MTTLADLGYNATQLGHAATMIRAVQAAGLPQRAAIVVAETGIVESNFRIEANSNVPASLLIPHDGVGSDHASVGILQQQVPSWGTVADCMDPAGCTSKFLHGAGSNPGLLTLPAYRFAFVGYPNATDWTQIPTGAAAQAVQVSAYPDRYQAMQGPALELVNLYWATKAPDSAGSSVLEEEMKDYLVHDGTGQFWVVARDLSHKTKVTTAAAKGLAASGQYLGNPGMDEQTLVNVPG